MYIDFSSPLLLFLSLFAFTATIFKLTTILLSKSKSKSKPVLNLPPGPRKLPVIGNLHHLARFQPPHYTLTKLALKYGPVMHLQLGEVPTVVVSSPETAKQVMKTHDINFANRPSLIVGEYLCYNNSNIAFAPYGDYWRQLRKICTIELLSKRRVQSFRAVREEEFSNLCSWIASQAGSTINLTEKVERSTLNAAMRAIIGKKETHLTALIHLIEEGGNLVTGFFLADLYPSIKFFRQCIKRMGRVPRMHKMADAIFQNVIEDHRAANNAESDSEHREDLLDILLKFNQPGQEMYLTIDNIKAVLQDMIGAGIEPSSTTVDWAMAEMLRHPRVLKKAQDEVRRVFGEKGFVDEGGLDELEYVKLVIKETQRMHPPLPLLLPRENREGCQIDGYDIPAKTRVLVNTWAIGRDPKYWTEANRFYPERFVDYKGNEFEYLPFGGGRRTCPGMSFGLANVELPLAMLLYHFDWVLPGGVKPENVDMTETLGITDKRKNPLFVIPITKKPLPS